MKLCSSHYDDVRSAIQHKGMGPLVGDIATLRERAERWLHGAVIPSDGFDPLMVTTLEIYKKATELIGTHLNMPRADRQHYCPLCEADRDASADCRIVMGGQLHRRRAGDMHCERPEIVEAMDDRQQDRGARNRHMPWWFLAYTRTLAFPVRPVRHRARLEQVRSLRAAPHPAVIKVK
jgi:hypothetical protein